MSTVDLTGQVAVITGAGGGMGEQHALLLARLGAAVVVNDLSPSAADVVARIGAEGGKAVVSHHDVADPEQASALVESAIEAFGAIHIVINNAAIIRNEPFTEIDYASFDKVMKVNAYGPFNVLKAAWPNLLEQRYGRVVMVSSVSAMYSQPLVGHYAASKGAVLGLSKTVAAEGADHGITVNVLSPGAFTQMAGAMEDEAARRQVEQMMPASLVAPVVAWLVRPENALNGQVIEAAAGRAALSFVGSAPGYWKRDLTVDDLVEHADQVLDRTGFAVLEDTAQMADWMTAANTGWPEILQG